MAVNLKQVYAFNRNLTREWPVAAGTLAGDAQVSISNQPGVAITNRGDATLTKEIGPISLTIPAGGFGNLADSATVAVDGSWAGPVTGATAATPKNTPVFATVAAGVVTELTLTAGGTPFGVVDSFLGKASATETVVKIGVFA